MTGGGVGVTVTDSGAGGGEAAAIVSGARPGGGVQPGGGTNALLGSAERIGGMAAGGGAVTVNGKPVADIMALRAGDQIGIGPVVARFAVVEAARHLLGEELRPDMVRARGREEEAARRHQRRREPRAGAGGAGSLRAPGQIPDGADRCAGGRAARPARCRAAPKSSSTISPVSRR